MLSTRTLRSLPSIALLLFIAEPTYAIRKFTRWFKVSGEDFEHISNEVCNATLKLYEDEYSKLGGASWIEMALKPSPIYGYCRDQMSCIIDNTEAGMQASLTASGVVLGLLPTLLAVISPSIAELALLSVHRPILSTLVSIGSPAVLQTRIFEYEDPAETLDLPDTEHAVTRTALALGPWGKVTAWTMSICEYLVVLVSAVNVLYLAYELGERSILSWGCTRSWPPLLWAAFPVSIHTLGAIAYRLTLDPATKLQKAPVILHKQGSFFTDVPLASSGQTTPQRDPKSGASTFTNDIPLLPMATSPTSRPDIVPTPRNRSRLGALIKRELLPCAVHPDTVINNRMPLTDPSTRAKWGIAINCFAGFLSCMHLLYGTVVFASFNFIDIRDAVGEIAMRFLASCVVCRLVILIEIAGMRGARLALVREREAKGEHFATVTGIDANGNPIQSQQPVRHRRHGGRFGKS